MNLTAKKRAGETKGEIKAMRRAGNIPGVFYSPGEPGKMIEVDGEKFAAALRSIKPGRLATTVFKLEVDGKKIDAIVKDIQYNRTTYEVIHLDFEELKKDIPVKVKVPIECVGVADCVGIKLGGFKRQVIRYVQVKCLPKSIPSQFDIDIRGLGIRQSLRLSDLDMPKGVDPMGKMDQVVVLIAKR